MKQAVVLLVLFVSTTSARLFGDDFVSYKRFKEIANARYVEDTEDVNAPGELEKTLDCTAACLRKKNGKYLHKCKRIGQKKCRKCRKERGCGDRKVFPDQ